MTEFKAFVGVIQEKFKSICHEANALFTVSIENSIDENGNDKTGDMLYDIYLQNFKPGDDPVFRNPDYTTHTCSNDRHFIRTYGNIVGISPDNQIVTMWDVELPEDSIYHAPCKAMANAVKAGVINNFFVITYDWLNHKTNYEAVNKNKSHFQLGFSEKHHMYSAEEAAVYGRVVANQVYTFNFFNVNLPKELVEFSNKSIETIRGMKNTVRQLFEKSLNIPLETLELVRDLATQGALLRGDMYMDKVLNLIKIKKEFNLVPQGQRNNWLWATCLVVPFPAFANELIGTLCIELAEGKELNKACRDFNMRVDPTNYQRAKSAVTPAMIANAEKAIAEAGYENSFDRRPATISDIDISEIRHSNIDHTVEKPAGLFGQAGVKVKAGEYNRHKRAEFDGVQTVTIDKFMEEVLPTATGIEVFLENKHESNFVTLFTEKQKGPQLFKWSNPFSWTYINNLSGVSQIQENVKAAGGKISGALRGSLQWNDNETMGIVDLDLHCRTPFTTIKYNNKQDYTSKGKLDVDMIRPTSTGVENIVFSNIPPDGTYIFMVENFDGGTHKGFKFEIQMSNEIFTYHYPHNLSYKGVVKIATITVKNRQMSIEHHMAETATNKTIWNLETGQFHKVNLVCTSPNHWGDNKIGTKEYFFMLQDCKFDTPLRGFHPDQLHNNLNAHRKSIELLSNFKLVEPTKEQLSGIGFNATVRNELIVKVSGTHKRVLKITF